MACMTSQLISPKVVARLAGVHVSAVVQAANSGRLQCTMTPLGRLFDLRDAQAWFDQRAKRVTTR